MSELRPYLKVAARYIKDYRDHPEIAKALRWLYALVYSKRTPVTYLRQKAHPSERLSRWLDNLRDAGVHEEKLLALVAALYLLQEREPHAFKSDRHFRHMLAIRFLRLAPSPRVPTWRNGAGGVRYDHIGITLRDHLSERLINNVGFVALRIARTLNDALNRTTERNITL